MTIHNPYWAAFDPDGYLICWTVSAARRYAIRRLLKADLFDLRGKTWRQLYRAGWRVVKVRIAPAEATS